ncbi:MAG: ABC transporter substrate-binding protein [Burkholderiales bacterium]|nr:ABC transporter substrate-binding protein [Burkholderiales bacterium]
MNRHLRAAFILLGAALAFAQPLPAIAQAEKIATRLVVGLSAGGTHDLVARALTEGLRKLLGTPVLVENKPGAGQRLALIDVKRSAPDGRTLLFASNAPFVIYPHTFRKLDYDPVKDFTPIGRLLIAELGLAVGPKVPVHNLKELAAWATANPKQTSFGTPGAGTGSHFAGIVLGKSIGVEFTHIPYKGGAPAMADLIGGHLPMVINSLPGMIEGHRAGKYRIIATIGARRSALVPELPTLKESGVDVVSEGGVWVYGPGGMPAELVKRLNAALVAAVTAPELRERLAKYGLILAPTSPEELAKLQADELNQWAEPVRSSGFKEDG